MLKINEIAYNSKIGKLDPIAKLIFGLSSIVMCLVANSLLSSVLVILTMSIITIFMSKISLKSYIRFMSIPLGFLFTAILVILIKRYPLGYDVIIGIKLGNVIYGADKNSMIFSIGILLRSLGVLCSMYFITLNTTINDLLVAFKRLRIPVIIISLMEMFYRYIFVLLEEAQRMYVAQASRNGYSGFRNSIKSLGNLSALLFIRSYIRCDKIFISLESRGYNIERRFIFKSYVFNKKWIIWSVIFSCAILFTAYAERRWLL